MSVMVNTSSNGMMNRQFKGTYSEVLAAAWLMRTGVHVYWGMGPCSIDLVTLNLATGEVQRVEVKSASRQVLASGIEMFYWGAKQSPVEDAPSPMR